MINATTYSPENSIVLEQPPKSKQANKAAVKRSNTVTNTQDCYTIDTKQNLKQGIKCGDVEYHKPCTILWGLFTLRDGYYTYKCNGHETIGQIKAKFGIPDRVIFNLNRIHDDDFCPDKDCEIAFDYQSTY